VKTTIIVKRTENSYIRTCRLSELPPEGETRPIQARAAHTVNSIPLNSRFEPGKERKVSYPDAIICGSFALDPERGRFDRVRVITDEFVSELEEIDRQIAELEKRRRDLAEDAYMRGKPITVAQAREWLTTPAKAVQS
jgi:hypothetical protein